MLNKEEIENIKLDLINLHHMLGKKPSVSTNAIENALEYINQLESELEMYKDFKDIINRKVRGIKLLTDKDIDKKVNERNKKLIEKLEEAIDFTKTSKDLISKAKIEVLENVLKILKGENE